MKSYKQSGQPYIIKMIINADLAEEEVVEILAACGGSELDKIQRPGALMKIRVTKENRIFAKKLKEFNLVSRQNRKDKKNIYLQVI